MADHEAHGRCGNCGYPAHRYPFGWQHVGTGMYSCPDLAPVARCCVAHAEQLTEIATNPFAVGRVVYPTLEAAQAAAARARVAYPSAVVAVVDRRTGLEVAR